AAGVVDEDVDVAEPLERAISDARGSVGREEVLLDDHQLSALPLQILQQVAAPRGDGEAYAFLRQRERDRPADADARAGDQRAFAGDAEFHQCLNSMMC